MTRTGVISQSIALAVSLNEESYGTLIDPFNGMEDLENKILRTPLNPP